MGFPLNFLSTQLLKVHFHSFFFIFKNFDIKNSQTRIIFRFFFYRNIIEIFFTCSIFSWLVHFSTIFQESYSIRTEKLKQDIVLPKCGFNFLRANWFNYLKYIIQLKIFTNLYKVKIIHFTLPYSCKKWICKMKCKTKRNLEINNYNFKCNKHTFIYDFQCVIKNLKRWLKFCISYMVL
jgi:hypothetical protein